MSEQKRNVPKLRFPGFTDAWEQRKLGELCSFAKGRGYSKADICDSGVPLILYGRLYTQYQARIDDVDTFAVEREGSLFSCGNEVIVPASGETAEDIAVASSVRRSGIVLGGDLNVLTPGLDLDPDYVALVITYGKTHSELAKRAQGKSVVHIHNDDIAAIDFSYPTAREQRAISSLALSFDDLITLHQRKLDHLKLQKRGLLQKMFPRDGSDGPEIRFPGFTDAWEQRKVSEIMHRATTFSDDPTLPNVEYEDVESGQGLLNKNLLEKAVAKKGLLFEPGDILFGKLRPYLKNWLRPAFSGIAVGDWWVLKPDLATSEFLYAFIQGSSFQNIANMSTGTKMPRSDWNLVANTEFGIPSEQEEQALIGSFFRDLDDLITLHQRKPDRVSNAVCALRRVFVACKF